MLVLAWAAVVASTGGVQWRLAGFMLRSRAPGRALVIGVILFAAQALLHRTAFARDVHRLMACVRPRLPVMALGCAAALGGHALQHGSFTAGGADSYGYVSQAYGWATGALPSAQPLGIAVPWPSGDQSLAPLGYRPGPVPHTMVPTYAPGLPLMMAAALVVGSCGPFLVVPACAALLVWLTFLLGRRIGGPWTGILSALLMVTSPVVLFQAMWPMSDVPAGAIWTGAALAALGAGRWSGAATGLWAAGGLLIRPNLLALPLVLFAHLALTAEGDERRRRLVLFCAVLVPALGAIAALNTAWYGAPWHSGYGSASEIYSAANVTANLARYPVWLWESQSPLLLLAAVPVMTRGRADASSPAVRLLLGMIIATAVSYLFYSPFDDWWYLRFLLPAIPALLVLTAGGLVTVGRRLPAPWGPVVVLAIAVAVASHTVRFASDRGIFSTLKGDERRYADIGSYAGQKLPPDAVILSVQQSGSLRFYAGRMTIRWDLIDRSWTSRAASELERIGLHPYMVIEDFELPQMRGWFGLPAASPLPWPLVARMREHGGVSLLDLASNPGPRVPESLEPQSGPLCVRQQPLRVERH
jgi:hypothetical protein